MTPCTLRSADKRSVIRTNICAVLHIAYVPPTYKLLDMHARTMLVCRRISSLHTASSVEECFGCGCRRSRSRRTWWSGDARLCAGRLCVPVPSTKPDSAGMHRGCGRNESVMLSLLPAAALVLNKNAHLCVLSHCMAPCWA